MHTEPVPKQFKLLVDVKELKILITALECLEFHSAMPAELRNKAVSLKDQLENTLKQS